MLKRLFNGQINSITVAAILVASSSLASRLLGIFRDRILAGQFGAGDTLDIYYAAFRIPDLIFNLLVLGALSAGFIPIFTNLLKNPLEKLKRAVLGDDNLLAWKLASHIINILTIGLVILCGLGAIFAPQIIKLITPGFSAEKIGLTASLTRIMFLSPIFLGLSGVLGGILQSFKRFFVYSLSPIFYNLGIIIGALFWTPVWGVYGLAWGVVLGAAAHMLIQLPTVFSLGFKYHLALGFKDVNVKKIAIMMIPRTLSLAISQIDLLITTVIASFLISGSLSIFNFANNLQSFPVGIFGISFAIAAFPALAAAAFNKPKLVANLSLTIRQVLFFIVPSMVILLTLRAQIIRVILGTGQFGWQATILTMNSLGFFAISLFAQALIPLLTRVFYARHDSKTPLYIGVFTVAINLSLSIILSRTMGVSGLALAFTVSNIFHYILLWLALHYEIGRLDDIKILTSTIKFSAAAILAGAAIQVMKLAVWPFIDMSRVWGVFTQGAMAGLTGIMVYLAVCYVLRSEELFDFMQAAKRRLPWSKVKTEDQGEARGM